MKPFVTTVCPVAPGTVDGNGARIVAGFVIVLLFAWYTYAHSWVIPSILVVDFILRSFSILRKWSFLRAGARILLTVFHIAPNPQNAGPKLFAARVGLVFSLVLLILSVSCLYQPSLIVAVIFGACAFLEAGLGFCVGCWVYAQYTHIVGIATKKNKQGNV